jgi:acyl-CoA thioesterase
MKPVYFSNSEFTVTYTQDIQKDIHTTSLEFTVHIHNYEKFNSQIVYSQHRSKIQYSQHQLSIFTLFSSISIEITV